MLDIVIIVASTIISITTMMTIHNADVFFSPLDFI